MNFYQQPFFPYTPNFGVSYQPISSQENPFTNDVINQQSYIENILRLNINKLATVYMNFENSQWGSKVFKGYIKAAGKDHIILKDSQSETRYLLLMVYLDYIVFDEKIEYDYPFQKKENKEY